MYLLGQALFSRELIETRFAPRSVRTVALCTDDDDVLRPPAKRYGVEIVVDPAGKINATRPQQQQNGGVASTSASATHADG